MSKKCATCGDSLPMFFRSAHKCRPRHPAPSYGVPISCRETSSWSDPAMSASLYGLTTSSPEPAPSSWSGGGGESGGGGSSASWSDSCSPSSSSYDSGSSCDSGSSGGGD